MMKKSLLLLALLIWIGTLSAQTEILRIETENDSTPPRFGPNRTHFVHSFFSFGLMAKIPADGNFHFAGSSQSTFGLLYKRKLSPHFSLGADLHFSSQNIRLAKDRPVLFPDTVLHSKESFRTSGLGGSLFIRFNLETRGNSIGKFIDIGAGGIFYTSRVYVYEDPLQGKEWKQVKIKNYDSILRQNAYLYGRLGINNFSIGLHYRIRPFFNPNARYPSAPTMLLNFTWGFF